MEIVTLLFNLLSSQRQKYILATGLLVVLFVMDYEKSCVYANNPRINELSVKQKENKAKPENLYQTNQYGEAIKIWLEKLNNTEDPEQRSVIYNNLAIAYQQIDKTAEAINQWQQAINCYESLSTLATPQNRQRLAKFRINQAQAYTAIGQQQEAILILKKVTSDLANIDAETISMAKGALGNAYFAQGKYELAIAAYQQSLQEPNSQEYSGIRQIPTNFRASSWLNLGNAFAKAADYYQRQSQIESSEGDRAEASRLKTLSNQAQVSAHAAYQQSLQKSSDALLTAQACINLARLRQSHNLSTIQNQQDNNCWQKSAELLEKVKPSHTQIFTLINLASLYQKTSPLSQIQILKQSLALAQELGDQQSISFALGEIGKVYESLGDYEQALQFTNRAQWMGQERNAADSLYRWQWQSGRILKAKGESELAIASYRQAIATLQSIRSDIVAAERSFQLDIREQVEPIYRELIELLIESNFTSQEFGAEVQRQDQKLAIAKALQVLDLLHLSELENFFGDECLEPKSNNQSAQDLIQSKSALVYSIILPQKTYLIAKLPDESLRIYKFALSKQELDAKIKRLRYTLENVATDEYLVPAKEMYDLLITPMEKDLRRSQVEQLVFVNDGIFQTVPMAALHDGKQFLIQKYPIIYLTDSKSNNFQNRNLSLETSSPKSSKLSLVSFGLSEAIAPFMALPNVVEELNQIKEVWTQKSLSDSQTGVVESFLNRRFTLETLQSQIKSGYDVVHLATHAKFGATPESTFLQAFDQKINLNQLESILRSSKSQIELLVLSACQTATGDSRATLGLAGVALRSGVKNVLATLWAVDDTDVVPLIREFYYAWQIEGLSKAQALQKSQIKGITENNLHPSSWSAFILVAN